MVSHCYFNLQFPNDIMYSIFSYAICCLYIFFVMCLLRSFVHFKYWIIYFLITEVLDFVVNFEQVFYQINLLQIFSCSLWLVFIVFMMSFADWEFLILMNPSLSIILSWIIAFVIVSNIGENLDDLFLSSESLILLCFTFRSMI